MLGFIESLPAHSPPISDFERPKNKDSHRGLSSTPIATMDLRSSSNNLRGVRRSGERTKGEDRLRDRANSYLESVVALARRTDEVVSVVVFGSLVSGGFSEGSDVDLIVVVSDDCSQKTLGRLNAILEGEAVRHGFSQRNHSFADRFLSALLTQTGIFVSHFVTRENDLLNLDFSRMFETNRILTPILAPRDAVLSGVLSHAKTIYGEDLLPLVRRRVHPGSGQLARSLLMNLLLALGALAVFPLTDRAVELSLEATKWSMFAGNYFVYGDSPGINAVAQRFISRGIAPRFLPRMIALRNARRASASFILMAPFAVVLLSLSARRLSTQIGGSVEGQS